MNGCLIPLTERNTIMCILVTRAGALTAIKDACAALNIKIDGFTLVKA
jgi:hypothetical protein